MDPDLIEYGSETLINSLLGFLLLTNRYYVDARGGGETAAGQGDTAAPDQVQDNEPGGRRGGKCCTILTAVVCIQKGIL